MTPKLEHPLKNYILVTGAYWVFTLTDGALRMLVLLHFFSLGYEAFQIALLFVLYELAGVVTNLIGGWIGSQLGLKVTLYVGLGLQVIALSALAKFDTTWPVWQAVVFVMGLQALSGVAKDLTKMSAKSAVKLVVAKDEDATLFKWVAILTGSKNTLKGVGFFLGGALLTWLGYEVALYGMAGAVALSFVAVLLLMTGDLGKAKEKVKFSVIYPSRQRSIFSPAPGSFSLAPGISGLSSACRCFWRASSIGTCEGNSWTMANDHKLQLSFNF